MFLEVHSSWLLHANVLRGCTAGENKVSEDTAAIIRGGVLGGRNWTVVAEMREK